MALAYKNFMEPPKEISWSFASARQREVIYGGYDGFKKAELSTERDRESRIEIAEMMDDYAFAVNKVPAMEKVMRPLTEAEKLYLEAAKLEKEGKPMDAMEMYRKAFKLQPNLEDEDINKTFS